MKEVIIDELLPLVSRLKEWTDTWKSETTNNLWKKNDITMTWAKKYCSVWQCY